MSVVPIETQFVPRDQKFRGSQQESTFILVYFDGISEHQNLLMSQCNVILTRLGVPNKLLKDNQLDSLPNSIVCFVIPCYREELIRRLNRFERARVILPRAIIEFIGIQVLELPTRTLLVSNSMYNLRVFLVKSCNEPIIRKRICEMSGEISLKFSGIDVVVADRADDKYCKKAAIQGIPVVSDKWVHDNYNLSLEERHEYFNKSALSSIDDYRMKPFYGLHFRIAISNSCDIKKLIIDNGGNVIYGDQGHTHVVVHNFTDHESGENDDITSKNLQKPQFVDAKFLTACAQAGYYILKRDYLANRTHLGPIFKQEVLSPDDPGFNQQQANIMRANNRTNTQSVIENNDLLKSNENYSVPPPPHFPRQAKQPDNMNDMILKALSDTQTQLASTQMRRLPDPELRIEQTFEPSQQLYWNDNVKRR